LTGLEGVPGKGRRLYFESVKEFFCFDIPRGGREIDNRKRIVSRKRKGKRKMDAIDLQSNVANRLISGLFLFDGGQIEGLE